MLGDALTVILQVPAAASVLVQVVDEIEKSPTAAPPKAGAAQPVAGDCPELVIVNVVLAAVAPTVVGEKE